MAKCKITVLKKMFYQDLVDEYREGTPTCPFFEEGQEFEVDMPFSPPDGFCPYAWADIRHNIMRVYFGGEAVGSFRSDVAITCCTDGVRPVIFKVARVE